jgi:protein SERAC1
VYGIAFFGVSHNGMDISSLIPLLESIRPIRSQILNIQQREFPDTLGGEGESEIICLYEIRESPTAIQVYPHSLTTDELY